MRTRALAVLALLAVSGDLAAAGAQRIPLPRIGRRTPTPTNPPEPTAGPIARQMAITRSRWSLSGYTLISSMRVPVNGGTSNSVAWGGGTTGEYRLNDYFTTTVDITTALTGGASSVTETAEVGTRFRPMPHDPEIRPFLDVRGGFMHMYDLYSTGVATDGSTGAPGPGTDLFSTSRYSRGFGGVIGTGMEVALTNTMALTTGISAMRNRMTVYRTTSPATVPVGTGYNLTAYRFEVGIRYNWIHLLDLPQKKTP